MKSSGIATRAGLLALLISLSVPIPSFSADCAITTVSGFSAQCRDCRWEGDYLKFVMDNQRKQVRKDNLVSVEWIGGTETAPGSAPTDTGYVSELTPGEAALVAAHTNSDASEAGGVIRTSSGDPLGCDEDTDRGVRAILDSARGGILLDGSGKLLVNSFFWALLDAGKRQELAKACAVYARCHNYHSSLWAIVYDQETLKKYAFWSPDRGYVEF